MSQKKAKQAEYGAGWKLAAVRRVLAGGSVREVAQELGIRRKRLYVWKDRYAALGEAGLAPQGGGRPWKETSVTARGSGTTAGRGELLAARKRIAELECKVGQQGVGTVFFRRSLAAHKSGRRSDLHVDHGAGPGKAASAWNECVS